MASRAPEKVLVSACLAGIDCNCKGGNNAIASIRAMAVSGAAIAACPEALGGLGIPREAAEITGGDGADVLAGRALVKTMSGRDVTKNFMRGAKLALEIAKQYGIRQAILKSGSPACGFGKIYDGTFSGTARKGNGVFTSLLVRNGIKVHSA